MNYYSHRQLAVWLFLILFLLEGLSITSILLSKAPVYLVFIIFMFFFIIMILFYQLNVEIIENKINLKFGVGLIKKTINISDIRECNIVKNKWIYGWGIRYYGDGWMWNISGLDAVELIFHNNKRFRIGSDEAHVLSDKINSLLNKV